MRQLLWALLFLSAYARADDEPKFDFRVFPPDIWHSAYEDSLRYAEKQYSLCEETFITQLLASEGVLDDIKAQVADGQRGYRSTWEIKDNRLFLTTFDSASESASQQIQQMIVDHHGYLPADWYTEDVYLGETDVMFSTCTFKSNTDLIRLSIVGGSVVDAVDISHEEYMQAMRKIIDLDALFRERYGDKTD